LETVWEELAAILVVVEAAAVIVVVVVVFQHRVGFLFDFTLSI
jgi:hypothetical protein